MRSAWGEFIRMIFVTTGSQRFQFNRLLQKIDLLIEEGMIREEVFAQIGVSDYQPKHYEYCRFLDREGFTGKLRECRMVITHGGTGVIIGAVKQGKKVIAVPRLASYGEHVDDHQFPRLEQPPYQILHDRSGSSPIQHSIPKRVLQLSLGVQHVLYDFHLRLSR